MLQRAKTKRVVISRKLEYAMVDLLRAHCHVSPEGFAVYDAPWTDELILEQFPTGVTINHVKSIRLSAVGKLRSHRPGAGQKRRELEVRIDALEKWAAQRGFVPGQPATLFDSVA